MVSLNKVLVIGNVGKDPEMRFTPNGNPVVSFSVAANHVYMTPEGERKEETEWFNIVCWNKLAETVNQYVSKGMQVYCEGRQKTRTWDDDQGQKHWKTELVANQVLFLGNKQPASGSQAEDPGADDIPFT
jgi:single-strand DNA-binding protein